MANEIVIIEKIDKRLRKQIEPKDNIFPLSASHRKELYYSLKDTDAFIDKVSNIKV